MNLREEIVQRIATELCRHTFSDGTPSPCNEHLDEGMRALDALLDGLEKSGNENLKDRAYWWAVAAALRGGE